VILEYIGEKWKGGDLYPLLPQYPYERAQARFWAQFADEKMTLLTFSPGYCLSVCFCCFVHVMRSTSSDGAVILLDAFRENSKYIVQSEAGSSLFCLQG